MPNAAVQETSIQNAQTATDTAVQEPIAQHNASESESAYAFPYVDSKAVLHTVNIPESFPVTTSEIEEEEDEDMCIAQDDSAAALSSVGGQNLMYAGDEMVVRARQRLGLPVYARGETLDDDTWSKRVLVCLYVYVYVCMYVRVYVCMYVGMYVCVCESMYAVYAGYEMVVRARQRLGLPVYARGETMDDDTWSKRVWVCMYVYVGMYVCV